MVFVLVFFSTQYIYTRCFFYQQTIKMQFGETDETKVLRWDGSGKSLGEMGDIDV